MRRRERPEIRCILDSGGVTSLTGRSDDARSRLRWLRSHRGDVIVPTPVLAECTTGDAGRDAEVNRVLAALDKAGAIIPAPDEATARRAGELRFRAHTDDGIDALVAAVALGDGSAAVVLTSDPTDLSRLLARYPAIEVRKV
jgi:predicted nucleic acid-binding protein